MATPQRTTAKAFPRYLSGQLLADSESLGWPHLYVRRWRFPRVVDRFLVPATAEPHISCNIAGSAEFLERDPGGAWITRQVRRGDSFITRSRTPYEVFPFSGGRRARKHLHASGGRAVSRRTGDDLSRRS